MANPLPKRTKPDAFSKFTAQAARPGKYPLGRSDTNRRETVREIYKSA